MNQSTTEKRILAFEKSSGAFLGVFSISLHEVARFAPSASLQGRLLEKTKEFGQYAFSHPLFSIQGMPDGHNGILDAIVQMKPGNPRYVQILTDSLAHNFPALHFVILEDPVPWSRIEQELGMYLGCGMLEETEQDSIVKRLPTMQEHEVLFIHSVLKEMHIRFNALTKG